MPMLAARRLPVKPARRTARKPGRFGAGILATRPSYRVPASVADVQWWAVETATAEDSHFDQLAGEAEFVSRSERGVA